MVRRPTIAPETSGTRIQIAASVAERSVLMYLTGGAELMRVSVEGGLTLLNSRIGLRACVSGIHR
ncbi:MAG: hypothetical protein WCJ47_07985, partial [Methanomicrobiales archaeon]